MQAILIALLCLVGLLISAYFTAVTHRWISPDSDWIPAFCRLEKQSCGLVVDTAQARLLGVPNCWLGVLFYPLLLAASTSGVLEKGPILDFFILASGVTVLLGLYLSYSLLWVLRVSCRLCFLSHGLNLALFVLLLLDL